MIPIIVIASFVATVLAALAVFGWLEARKESLPHRFRKLTETPAEPRKDVVGNVAKRARDLWNRLLSKKPAREEIVEMFMGKELSGPRLLLHQAGYRSAISYGAYWWVKAGTPAVLAVLAFGYGIAAGWPTRTVAFVALIAAIAGFVSPDFILRFKIRKRQECITDSLPDALDLMVVCVEAGLGLNAAFIKIAEEFKLPAPALSEEFDVVNREMVAGKPRQEALRALADRTGVEEVKSLVAMLVQTEKLGTSLSQSLRVHSDSLRTRRRQRAEEAAAKTTIKLVFPLVFLLFPALFVVILGPGVIQLIQTLLPVVQK